jgi:MFS family permease
MKIHKAWVMMGACCVLMMSLALNTTCLSLFTEPVTEALGFPRSAFTAYISIAGVMTAIGVTVWGRALPKLGMKRMIVISGVMIGACFVLAGRADSLWQFYAVGVVFGVFSPAVTVLPQAVTINNWFVEKKGLAMGVTMAFSGVGAAVFSPLLAIIINSRGWEWGYVTIGIATTLLSVPVALFVLKSSPDELGMTPYGAQAAEESVGDAGTDRSGVLFSVAVRSFPFYGALISVALASIAVVSLSQHIPAHLVSKGLPTVQGGVAMSILAVGMIFAKVGLGWLNDRAGTMAGMLVCYALGFAGLLLILLVRGDAMPVPALLVLACGIPVTTVWPPLLTAKLFGQKNFPKIFTFIQSVAILGYGLGTPLYGMSFDRTGSYNAMLIVGLVMMPVAAVLLVLSIKRSAGLTRAPGTG